MKNTTVKWHNEDYNLNCNIEDLEKLGFTALHITMTLHHHT